jgi:hypothetical protein
MVLLVLITICIVYALFREYCKSITLNRLKNHNKYTFSENVSSIDTGDLLLYYAFDANDFENLLNNDDWTHVSIVVRDNTKLLTYELIPCKHGITIKPFDINVNEYCGSIIVLKPKYITYDQQNKLKQILHEITMELTTQTPKRSYFSLVNSTLRTLISHKNLSWCSSLIAYVYNKLGIIELDKLNELFLLPQQFLTNKYLINQFTPPSWIKKQNPNIPCTFANSKKFGLCLK